MVHTLPPVVDANCETFRLLAFKEEEFSIEADKEDDDEEEDNDGSAEDNNKEEEDDDTPVGTGIYVCTGVDSE